MGIASIDIYETQTPASASTIDRLQGQEYDIVILSLVDDGVITEEEKDEIVAEAAQSDCGKKN